MALVAALAATVWMLSSSPAEAEPVFASPDPYNAPSGLLVSAPVEEVFSNAGTNPRFTNAVFSTMDYYDASATGIPTAADVRGYLFVQVKTDAQLNALDRPPTSPFTVTADVTMTNDEGQTATGTISFRSTYTMTNPPPSDPPEIASTEPLNAPVGVLVSISAADTFDNAGTNPRFASATFSTMDYYNDVDTGLNAQKSRLFVRTKTSAELNALALPPANPFTVTAEVTMTNDQGQTATGTISFVSTYIRTVSVPGNPQGVVPEIASTEPLNAPAGVLVSISAADTFDNAGTNPKFASATFSTMDYYNDVDTGLNVQKSHLFVKTKTPAELSALEEPPASPFTVTATVTMTNDEGQTASGTVTFETTYTRVTNPAQAPAQTQPTFVATSNISAVPGVTSRVPITDIFHNRGTNARLTGAVFSTMDYYRNQNTGVAYRNTYLNVHAKTDAQLNALDEPPASPFTVTATVTMTNDENQTASGTITFETTYTRPSSSPLEGSSPPTVISELSPVNAPPGVISSTTAPLVFDNRGTNARFTEVEFSTMDYYVAQLSRIFEGRLNVFVKTAAQLNALEEPPASPFTVTATVTMTNDEGHTATGTVSIRTTYDRDD